MLEELGRMAFANLHDFVRFDANGRPEVDWSRVGREQLAGLNELSIEEATGRKMKVKLAKVAGLQGLGRYFKLFTEGIDLHVRKKGGGSAHEFTEEELLQIVAGGELEDGS